MVFDTLEKIGLFKNLTENIGYAINYIQTTDLSKLSIGKHEIHGNDVFVIVSEYQTKAPEECKPEAHRNYIDIQMLISGEELIGYAPIKNQKVEIEYSEESDVVFYQSKTNKIKIYPGEFAIFFPQDIHQPGIMIKEPQKVKKAVVKISVK